jgi:hypothetical protein
MLLEIAVIVIEALAGGVTCDSMVAIEAVRVIVGVTEGAGIVGGAEIRSLVGAAAFEGVRVGVREASGVRDALSRPICKGS